MQRAIFVAMMLIVAVMLVSRGCSSGSKVTSPDEALKMLSGDWVLKQLGGKDVASMLGQNGRPPTMSFANDGRVSGFSGVNRYTSTIDVDRLAKNGFKLDGIASTRMAGPPEAMDLESKFTQALQEATGFKLDGSNLNLTKGTETLLKFARGG